MDKFDGDQPEYAVLKDGNGQQTTGDDAGRDGAGGIVTFQQSALEAGKWRRNKKKP